MSDSQDRRDGQERRALRFGKTEGKLQWSLLWWGPLKVAVRVMMRGAKKYAPRNWEKGMPYTEGWDSLMRHSIAWWEGEDLDPESGEHHLGHTLCSAAFLLFYELNPALKARFDDRPKLPDEDDV
jgi:hypothetical protein